MRVAAPRIALSAGLALAAGLVLAGCSTPSTPVVDDPETPDTPSVPAGPVPAWYGDSFDAAGCPVPSGSDLAAVADPAAFLGASLPDGWCFYKSTSYTTYYALPATEVDDPGTDVRAALEPAGWAFDPVDDGSPQWSWITSFPEAAAADFSDGDVDGSIFVSSAVTADDIDAYTIWYSSLFSSFGDWSEGDYVAIVGFW
ncbi:MAG: hypothetical protein KF727_03785 [Microbacteriaceae bacterium]|nr:hypothetical protein [Microbacteriaceae bacterium]